MIRSGAGAGWTRRAVDVAIGLGAAVVLFAGVPVVLAVMVGVPLPARWSGNDVASWHGLFDLAAVVAWCAWAACAWPLLRSVAARVRTGDTSSGGRIVDRIAVRIAIGVLAAFPVFGIATLAGAAPSQPVRATSVAGAPVTRSDVASVEGLPAAPASPVASTPAGQTYTVEPGDSLWTIAQTCYGDAAMWQAIAAANLGRPMGDGAVFDDPSLIEPGWSLVLPAAAAAAAAVTGAPAAAVTGAPATQAAPTIGRTALLASRASPGRAVRRSATPATRREHRSATPPDLPDLAVLGCGALVVALAARRARRARRLRAFVREEGVPSIPPSDRAADVSAAIGGYEDLPLLDAVEAAAQYMDGGEAHRVRLVRAAGDGVELRFGSPPPPPPASGWTWTATSWLLPAQREAHAQPARAGMQEAPRLVLVPIGDNDQGSWLVPLHDGLCLRVVGEDAPRMVAAMRTALAGWTWHEQLTVTTDPATAATAVATAPADDGRQSGVAFFGDPTLLPEHVRVRCAVVTTAHGTHADLTLFVDVHGASLHPLGLTVRPHLLTDADAAALQELERPPDETSGPPPRPARGGSRRAEPRTAPLVEHAGRRATVRLREHGVAPLAPLDALALEPPSVQVRLLTALPRIDGLQQTLHPKRARRAVELVAYLALHHPDPVTGDRLRTRVLGTADADAAAKTLFNTAGAARRALGLDAEGHALFPAASRSGHYRLSPAVTVDALRACALIEAGMEATDPQACMALVREGLAQIEGEPLAGVLSGYAWWRAEGHERRLCDTVVDGCCLLVRQAISADHHKLARWAIDQARLVEPYSEALTRAAMQLAAAAGDARRLQAEWEECTRQMDELDPGGVPSEATERLYARLRQLGPSANGRPGEGAMALT